MSKFSTRTLAAIALLTALEIILSRFLSISLWNTKIGFSFLPIAVAAILYGPLAAGSVGALGDFIGAILFPIGAYFPGFTLTAFLTGLVYGIFLHKRQGWPQIISAVGINQLILSLLLNTLWISILYGSVYGPLLISRLPQTAILIVVQLICIPAAANAITRYGKKASST